MEVQAALLSGDRLHLQHGPIDLIIGVEGDRAKAFAAARARLSSILAELMDEIDLLKLADGPAPKGVVARKMWKAVQKHHGFVTPMAGVAGAVAETVLTAMTEAADLKRAYVNNGGDIALHLTGDATFSVAMAGVNGDALGKLKLTANDAIRGIATSGQRGRSLSFGIAESVTTLAQSASMADVAATLIAGAVDLPDHLAIKRVPAEQVRDESDLGARDVVTYVGSLSKADCANALDAGLRTARAMRNNKLIQAASLHLRGQSRQIDLNTRKVLAHA
ncbi:UPF0280 family protein [Planktotalea sp.]|uniref:UPF0280 family protein n=1 Tax=Planktotalea sp. TaxID=2029877 RepID=UPI0032998EE3